MRRRAAAGDDSGGSEDDDSQDSDDAWGEGAPRREMDDADGAPGEERPVDEDASSSDDEDDDDSDEEEGEDGEVAWEDGPGELPVEEPVAPEVEKKEREERLAASVPTRGFFFMHDDRSSGRGGGRGRGRGRGGLYSQPQQPKEDDAVWKHDKFEQLMLEDPPPRRQDRRAERRNGGAPALRGGRGGGGGYGIRAPSQPERVQTARPRAPAVGAADHAATLSRAAVHA